MIWANLNFLWIIKSDSDENVNQIESIRTNQDDMKEEQEHCESEEPQDQLIQKNHNSSLLRNLKGPGERLKIISLNYQDIKVVLRRKYILEIICIIGTDIFVEHLSDTLTHITF